MYDRAPTIGTQADNIRYAGSEHPLLGCDRSLILKPGADLNPYVIAWSLASAVLGNSAPPRPHRVVAPASTPMAAQAPELPAGREPMSRRWCYFCGRRGQPTRGCSRGKKRVAFVSGSSSQAAGMQSWIRDLIDLKTQISVLQNCMQQPASSHAAPTSHYRVADKSEPWTGGAAAIYPATAWPCGLLRQRPINKV
jgi:hypothetical protein